LPARTNAAQPVVPAQASAASRSEWSDASEIAARNPFPKTTSDSAAAAIRKNATISFARALLLA